MSSIKAAGNGLSDNARRAAEEFGFDSIDDAVSLCPYGPVFKMPLGGKEYVLKRTGYPRSNADAIAGWLKHLRRQNVAAVAPCDGFGLNPRKMNDTDVFSWVVYEFVQGTKYSGRQNEIYNAGCLLGEIHLAGREYSGALMCPVEIIAVEEKIIRDRLKKTINMAESLYYKRKISIEKHEYILTVANRSILNNDLPYTACSWDYKASNLIVDNQNRMTLVDPDHGGRIPRIYDLACALVLFHCDHDAGPRRLWQLGEWRSFLKGYTRYIAITDREMMAWTNAICLAWVNEGLWLLANFPEGWADSGESQYLISLFSFDPSQFLLEAATWT